MHLNGKGYKATLEGENRDDATSGDVKVRPIETGAGESLAPRLLAPRYYYRTRSGDAPEMRRVVVTV